MQNDVRTVRKSAPQPVCAELSPFPCSFWPAQVYPDPCKPVNKTLQLTISQLYSLLLLQTFPTDVDVKPQYTAELVTAPCGSSFPRAVLDVLHGLDQTLCSVLNIIRTGLHILTAEAFNTKVRVVRNTHVADGAWSWRTRSDENNM
jgi:hypothetical protein